jgi:hypothetical protein
MTELNSQSVIPNERLRALGRCVLAWTISPYGLALIWDSVALTLASF